MTTGGAVSAGGDPFFNELAELHRQRNVKRGARRHVFLNL
jgi:hypothetical protein